MHRSDTCVQNLKDVSVWNLWYIGCTCSKPVTMPKVVAFQMYSYRNSDVEQSGTNIFGTKYIESWTCDMNNIEVQYLRYRCAGPKVDKNTIE